MMKLTIEPLLPEAFAPFGTVVRAPAEVARTPFPAALGNLRPDARATLSASRALPKTLPLTSTVMERHRYSSQTFLPLDVERYIVLVAPHSPTGAPDMLRARAFVVPGDTGISYAADSWHDPMIVLDRPGCFAVLLWRDGTPADIETIALDEPLEIVAAGSS
jgi:ureidoglycolate lyase